MELQQATEVFAKDGQTFRRGLGELDSFGAKDR